MCPPPYRLSMPISPLATTAAIDTRMAVIPAQCMRDHGVWAAGGLDFARQLFGSRGFPDTLEAHSGEHCLPAALTSIAFRTFFSVAMPISGGANHADGKCRETQRESKRRVVATRYAATAKRPDAVESFRGGACQCRQCVGATTECRTVEHGWHRCNTDHGRRCPGIGPHDPIDGSGERSAQRRGHGARRIHQGCAGERYISNRFISYRGRHASRFTRIDVAKRRDLTTLTFVVIPQRPIGPLQAVVFSPLPLLPACASHVTLPPFRFLPDSL